MKKAISCKTLPAVLASVLVFALSVLLVVLIHLAPGSERYANAVNPFFLLQPDSVTEEVIPDYAGIRRTYAFTLPEADSATTTGARLSVYLRHTLAEFSVDDSTLYNDLTESETTHIGKTPGSYWISIPVRPAYAGKTVRVTLTPVYGSVRNEEPVFMVIGRDTLLGMVELPKDGFLLILSFTAVISGLFLVLCSLALPLDGKYRRRIFCLGALTVAAGLWKLCGLPVVTLILDYAGIHKEIWFTGAVSYLCMMVLSLRLLTVMRDDGGNRTGEICFYISAGAAALLLFLQILNLAELHQALIWYGIGMTVLHFISLFGKKPGRSELLWLLPFFLALGVDLVIFLVTGSMRGAPTFLIWIVLNLFVRGFGFIREAILRERDLRKKEEELRSAKVKTMMNQIRPHFIYNTLSSVYVLCRDDPPRAMEVIRDFTAYLQANFTAISAENLIAFTDELRHTKAYLAVEAIRYGDKLTVEFDTQHTAFRLPALTLQPLVENAVKHGLGKGIGPEHITVRTRSEDGRAVITVEDDGPGIGPESEDSGVHVGLSNVRERLELMCGGTLDTAPRPDGGTIVTVMIPRD
ncbi:MAG: histidine kinase [Clostridia bacterium]|nr:histidine kinase [Clostridia bacterium]